MKTYVLAASPVLNPGPGCNLFRVVLRCTYKDDDTPDQFIVHKQYLLKAHPDGDVKEDMLTYGDGYYFPGFNDDPKIAYKKALECWYKKMAEQVWPLASFEDIDRFYDQLR